MSLTAMIHMKDKMYVDIETSGSDNNKVDIIFSRVKNLQGMLETIEEEATVAKVPLVRRLSMNSMGRRDINQLSKDGRTFPSMQGTKTSGSFKTRVKKMMTQRKGASKWYHNFKALHGALQSYRQWAALLGMTGTLFAVAENEYLMQGGGQNDVTMNALKAMNSICTLSCAAFILRMYYIAQLLEAVSLHVHCFTDLVRTSSRHLLLTDTCDRTPMLECGGCWTRPCGWSSSSSSSTTPRHTDSCWVSSRG